MDTITDTVKDTAARAGYVIRPIPSDVLARLRERDDAGRPPRLLTDEEGGSPLRCCLAASRPGERIALVSYAPLHRWAEATGADPGPYDETGPVFVHPRPCVPRAVPQIRPGASRVLRAYDADGHILGGRQVLWPDTDAAAGRLYEDALSDPRVAVLHVRAVEYGCFQFEVARA